ncbi:MAG: hypothetical protein JWQ50_6819 [Caballeronia mineralivorans]|jgi:hypothetical protein|nr:hypothetical protein [Caballeronia mineralivorans]MDQ1410978.1 hypothetical protein [Acidobacteriaceae bacterium]
MHNVGAPHHFNQELHRDTLILPTRRAIWLRSQHRPDVMVQKFTRFKTLSRLA